MSKDDAALFERVVTGVLAPDDSEVQLRAGQSAALAAALADWKAMLGELDGGRLGTRDAIVRARLETTVDDEQLVARLISSCADNGGSFAARATRRRWLMLGGAAAAALTIAVFARDRGRDGALPNGLLGSEGARRPVGSVSSFATFEVDVALPTWWKVEFVIYDAFDREVLRSPRIEGSTWTLTDEQRQQIERSPTIHWTFVVRDAEGTRIQSGASEATLSR